MARTTGSLAAAAYLLRNTMLEHLFNDIPGENNACAQDGAPDVPKTDRGVRLNAQLIYAMLRHRILHVPARCRLLLLHFESIFVFINKMLR